MKKETDLKQCKEIAKAFVYLPFTIADYGIVQHPFINNIMIPALNDKGRVEPNLFGEFEYYDIRKEKDLAQVQDIYIKAIGSVEKYIEFMMMIQKPYLPAFFKYTEQYLDIQDYSEFLGTMWTYVEYTNTDSNISPSSFVRLFKRANKKILMSEEEFKDFEALPQEITIYRGVKPRSTTKALSWTTDKNVAQWFADRFTKDGIVYQAKIQKQDVLAYFSERGESEVVIDFNKMYKMEEI